MKRTRRFRVICPNCLIGMGERNDNPEMEDLCAVAERWGTGPVHPGPVTYALMAGGLMEELERPASALH